MASYFIFIIQDIAIPYHIKKDKSLMDWTGWLFPIHLSRDCFVFFLPKDFLVPAERASTHRCGHQPARPLSIHPSASLLLL